MDPEHAGRFDDGGLQREPKNRCGAERGEDRDGPSFTELRSHEPPYAEAYRDSVQENGEPQSLRAAESDADPDADPDAR